MPKILVKLHDLSEYTTTVENYDASQVAKDLADEAKAHIVVGDIVVHRSNVSRIVKLED